MRSSVMASIAEIKKEVISHLYTARNSLIYYESDIPELLTIQNQLEDVIAQVDKFDQEELLDEKKLEQLRQQVGHLLQQATSTIEKNIGTSPLIDKDEARDIIQNIHNKAKTAMNALADVKAKTEKIVEAQQEAKQSQREFRRERYEILHGQKKRGASYSQSDYQ